MASFSTLIFLAPSIAICATIIGPFLLVISKLLSKRLKKIYKESQEIDIKYKSFMQETLQNIMIVKTFCMEKFNLTKLEKLQKKQYSLAIKNTKLSSLTQFSVNLSSNLAYFAIFC
ncbi:MAG: ABC transporter transmembrane domain-containing protein, partial [Clostridium butyricum]|nr:ABC transporter transmembrane domain-containing protein [Clostridium butyricum]